MTEEIIVFNKSDVESIEEAIKRLEQENKELKEENITAQKEYWKLEQGNDFLAEKVRLYRSALEEIREIEELPYYSKGMLEEPLSQWDFILHAIDYYEQRRIKILTKINEVLNEKEL